MIVDLARVWEFALPTRICFGEGVRSMLANTLQDYNCIALVSSPAGRLRIECDDSFNELLALKNLVWIDSVKSNPDVDDVDEMAASIENKGITAVAAIGGGSAIDSAKAIAARLSCSSGLSIRDIISAPSILDNSLQLPLFAIPTTAGTGSEVTPFTTLWDERAKRKLSLSHPNIFPKQTFIDPELTYNLPEIVTVSGGLDALNQAAESLWSRKASPVTHALSIRAFSAALLALTRLTNAPSDLAARCLMMEGSLLAGTAISQTRTALCHSISYPLTARFGVPHGLACAFSMRSVLRLNARHDYKRFVELASHLGLSGVEELEEKLQHLFRELGLGGRLRCYIPSLEALIPLVDEMFTPGRADNNLAPVDASVIESVLHESWQHMVDEDGS